MQNAVKAILLLAAGAGVGASLVWLLDGGSGARAGGRTSTHAVQEKDRIIFENGERIAQLEAEIERLKGELEAVRPHEPDPYPNDSIEKIEELLEAAYAENNVDWLLEVIERLLRMGEKGYPILRRLLEDIIFKARFLPSQSDFRFDQLYRVGRIFADNERRFIGFINYLLTDPQTNAWFKRGAMVAGAWFVGSKAPGTDELQQTLLQSFLAQGGAGLPGDFLMGNMGKRMQIFAVAMSGDPEMIEPLRDELNKTKDKRLQGDIIGALAYLGDPQALPLIKDRLDPASKEDYRGEIRALGRLGTEEAHETATEFVRAIPDSKRYFRHAAMYVRAGGGDVGVKLIRERVEANPDDPEVNSAIGTLRRFPTKESRDTLRVISTSASDKKIADRAARAAEEVDRRLRGEIPEPPK